MMMVMLLAGFFIAPALLLWLGHGLRRRTARARRAFWGGVIGHSLGMLVTLIAAHSPANPWSEGGWRSAAVHGAMLAGALLGAALGAMAGSRRSHDAGSTKRLHLGNPKL